MDKTEMYNKIINAIDVMSRVYGEDILFEVQDGAGAGVFKITYRMGEITVYKWNTYHLPEVFVGDLCATPYLEDNHLETILSSIKRLYDNKCKKLDEENKWYAIEYLNGFVGK
jgi:hypothetical protein